MIKIEYDKLNLKDFSLMLTCISRSCLTSKYQLLSFGKKVITLKQYAMFCVM